MAYSETIEFLYKQFPCFQHVGKSAYVPSLKNTKDLLIYLGHPEKKMRCIHVAGTNGKGSTSHTIASILQESGYSVGLFTSPHLVDFSERIRVNGENISKRYVINFVKKHQEKLLSMRASLFEVTTAMAFDYFCYKQVDFAVVEVGLGGRLDSTNVIQPILSVITNIGFDHMQILGNTLPEIATEKAGIIKTHTPVVIGEWNCETAPVFEEVAKKNQAEIIFASQCYSLQCVENENGIWNGSFTILENEKSLLHAKNGLLGDYQKKNTLTIFAAIRALQYCGVAIPYRAIQQGFRNVVTNTHLMGRWQIVATKPLTICDTGHNYDGISYTMPQLLNLGKKDVRIVWGMVGDKDIASIQHILPSEATYYLCKPSIERAMPLERLKSFFEDKNFTCYETIEKAYRVAKQNVTNDTVIYVGGSSYVVAEFLSKKIVKHLEEIKK